MRFFPEGAPADPGAPAAVASGGFATIHRPYKERAADDTIALVRRALADLGLLPVEAFHANPYPGLYSCSLDLPAELGGFHSNGKGRTEAYSLASAYAEFAERLQNGLYATFSRTLTSGFRERHGFYYAPDERYLSAADLATLPSEALADFVRYQGAGRNEFLDRYHERVLANGAPGVVAVPFYDTRAGEVVAFPFNLLLLTVGSNGMAAGNTQAEAVYQALCELLERWGAAEVFYGRLTPPTVPRSYLAGLEAEAAVIAAIEASGRYRVTVKDFSAGRRIPALGVIVENVADHTYRLNVGSDTCFQVNLSRCLTEVYQGVSNDAAFDEAALPILTQEQEFFRDDSDESLHGRYSEFGQYTKDNRGQFPLALFGETPSYAFDASVWEQRDSHVEEVRRLVGFFHDCGHDVYLRDVTFLGLPSVFAYVPEVSALGRKNVPPPAMGEDPLMLALDRVEEELLHLGSATPDALAAVATVLDQVAPPVGFLDVAGIKVREQSPWSRVSVAFVRALLWWRLGDAVRAHDAYRTFLGLRADGGHPYERLVARYLERRAEGQDAGAAASGLADSVEEEPWAALVVADLADPADALAHVALPNCPDCGACALRTECATLGKLTAMDRLMPAMAASPADQRELAWARP